MKIYKYNSYEEYVAAQVEANVRKINNIWVRRTTIEKIHQHCPNAQTILCHGTRNAAEQKFFKEFYSQAEIVGTEISHTASQFPMTVQWDFHEVKQEWLSKFDIIYSNAFDHSYDPIKCLSTWRDQLNSYGRLFLELSLGKDNVSKYSDPLSLTEYELAQLLLQLDCVINKSIDLKNNSKLIIIKKL
jgi:hypothetical protein